MDDRRRGGDAGPRSGRLAPRRRLVRQGVRLGARAFRSCPCIIWQATSSRSCWRTASCRCRPPFSSSRAGTPACIWSPSPESYRLIGRTRDDAAGEAYDKVAKLLGLGYPGGPIIDRSRARQRPGVGFPVARLTHADRNASAPRPPACCHPSVARRIDFSFSGLKTAVLRQVRERTGMPASGPAASADGSGAALSARSWRTLRQLSARRRRRAARSDVRSRAIGSARSSVGIAGGVSANSRLRADAQTRGERAGIPVFVPPLALSTDNAAMIGAAGLRRFVRARWRVGL